MTKRIGFNIKSYRVDQMTGESTYNKPENIRAAAFNYRLCQLTVSAHSRDLHNLNRDEVSSFWARH